jgi:hypothetical protein
MTINILVFQKEGDICRFIYQLEHSLDMHVVACVNYYGMIDLLNRCDAKQISNDINIYDYRRDMYREELQQENNMTF